MKDIHNWAKRLGLRETRCCGTCRHHQGWMDNMWCGIHEELNTLYMVQPYTICNDYTPQSDNPDLVEMPAHDSTTTP